MDSKLTFKIEKEEFINKTFRINKNLIDKLEKIADSKNISVNKLVVLCITFALKNLDSNEKND